MSTSQEGGSSCSGTQLVLRVPIRWGLTPVVRGRRYIATRSNHDRKNECDCYQRVTLCADDLARGSHFRANSSTVVGLGAKGAVNLSTHKKSTANATKILPDKFGKNCRGVFFSAIAEVVGVCGRGVKSGARLCADSGFSSIASYLDSWALCRSCGRQCVLAKMLE